MSINVKVLSVAVCPGDGVSDHGAGQGVLQLVILIAANKSNIMLLVDHNINDLHRDTIFS